MGRHKKDASGASKEYVNNAALLRELKLSRERDCLTNDAIYMFQLMCENI